MRTDPVQRKALEKRRLGRTEIEVTRLGLGTIPLMRLNATQSIEVISSALDSGINFIDTARAYQDAEEKIGAALRGRRETCYVATKSFARTKSGMSEDVRRSLKAFQADYLDLYQLHSVKTNEELVQVLSPSGALAALKEAQAAGLVRHIGITGHRPSALVKALQSGEFSTVQVPVNIVDREAEEELLDLAATLDIGTIAMKPLAGGTLDHPRGALHYVLDQAVTVAIPGMGSVAEVREDVLAAIEFSPLSGEERDRILLEAAQVGKSFCRRCGYCTPCPEGIDIPRILWLANYGARYRDRDPWVIEDYADLDKGSQNCVECGLCEPQCPYDLPIIQMLRHADQLLKPDSGLKQVVRRTRRMLASRVKGIG